ncbi:unnamed protein product [Cylindrotheca closterium]|uniref:Uncharacterized protein n=1 Tax=Cylindrotheca closterium TaxID=2856 RepID=A0AAD2JKS9_9STRA|nr:unnamed protein product [Cylindrotheca closterium]
MLLLPRGRSPPCPTLFCSYRSCRMVKRHLALRTWMQTQQTAPEIEAFLFEYLKTVGQPSLGVTTSQAWSRHPHLFQSAISSQAMLGAQGLLEGLVPSNWRHLQALHFSYIGSKKSANLWASRLIPRPEWQDASHWFNSTGLTSVW